MFLAMPHLYNRRAFGSVVRYSFGPADDDSLRLLALYCALVQLALKDHDTSFRKKAHDVCAMLDDLSIDTALVVQLRNGLQTLQCVRSDGGCGPVRPEKYPDLRYLRHESDFPGESTTQELEHALDLLRDIEQELRSKGIAL